MVEMENGEQLTFLMTIQCEEQEEEQTLRYYHFRYYLCVRSFVVFDVGAVVVGQYSTDDVDDDDHDDGISVDQEETFHSSFANLVEHPIR